MYRMNSLDPQPSLLDRLTPQQRTARRPRSLLLTCALLMLSAMSTVALAAPLDPADHLKGESLEMKRSGEVKLGEKMAFFSGWLTNGSVLSLPLLLKKQKSRYVITMCASWCEPCFEGLKAISRAKELFQQRDVELVVYVADSEKAAKDINQRFGFDWGSVLIDEFKSHARKLAVSQTAESKKGQETLELPRTFVLNRDGKVEKIIGREGRDYIKLLTGGD